MISAKDAYEKTSILKEKKEETILKEIESLIEYSIREGSYDTSIYRSIPNSIIEKLKELGYKVEVCKYRNEITTNISWDVVK